MASVIRRSWSLRQHFSWRPSTVLLLYVAACATVGALQPWIPAVLQSAMNWVQETLGPGALLVCFPAAILALAFLIASLLKRNPQMQFLIEVFVAIGILILAPTY